MMKQINDDLIWFEIVLFYLNSSFVQWMIFGLDVLDDKNPQF